MVSMPQAMIQAVGRSLVLGTPAECPDQRDKNAACQRDRRQTFGGLIDLFKHLTGPIPHRDHETSAGFELVHESGWNLRGTGRYQDGVKGGLFRPTPRTVA